MLSFGPTCCIMSVVCEYENNKYQSKLQEKDA